MNRKCFRFRNEDAPGAGKSDECETKHLGDEMSTIQTTDTTSAELIAAHPELTAAAPAWAETIDPEIDGTHIAVSYDRSFGSVEIALAAHAQDGSVHFPDKSPAFVYFTENETGVTAADLRQFAADFLAAA